MKRRIMVPLTALLMALMFSVTVFAANPVIPKTSFDYRGTDVTASAVTPYRTETAFLKDEADILSEAQEKDIWERIQTLADDLQIKTAVFLGGNYRTDEETEAFTYDCTAAIFGSSSDALFLYLDFEGYSPAYDNIRAFNRADDIYTAEKRNKILNRMYQYLPKSGESIYPEDVSKALVSGIEEIRSLRQQGASVREQRPADIQQSDTKSDSALGSFFQTIPLPLIITFIAFIVLLILISAIKNAFRRRSSSSYRSDGFEPGDYHSGYYRGGGSNYHSSYRRPPRERPPRERPPRERPPRESRPPRSSSSSSRSSSSQNHSSSSGHHR